jgi:two-component system OmpR family response regulator
MRKQRVLVVDDDRHARDALALLLQDEGYEVRTAADGVAAFSELSRFFPDVIITDTSMPRMDGSSLAAAVRALPGIPPKVILMCAEERDDDAEAPVVRKPIAFDELLALM